MKEITADIKRILNWWIFRFAPRFFSRIHVSNYSNALPYHSGRTGIRSAIQVRHSKSFDVPLLRFRDFVSDSWSPPSYYQKLRTQDVEIYNSGACFISPEGVTISILGISERQFIYTSERTSITPYKMVNYRLNDVFHFNVNSVIVLHDRWSVTNYFHWITESLVKLLLVRDRPEYAEVPVLVPEHAAPFVIQSIRLLDPKRSIVVMPNDRLMWVRNSIHVDYSRCSGTHDPEMVRRVADELLRCALPFNNHKLGGEFLYISRSDAANRKLINEQELFPLFQQNGISPVILSGMDLVDQINLFRNCRTLIGPHGAGLTNGLFMPKGSTVIEITSADKLTYPGLRYCFYSLISPLDINYIPVVVTSVNPDEVEANLVLEPSTMEALISYLRKHKFDTNEL